MCKGVTVQCFQGYIRDHNAPLPSAPSHRMHTQEHAHRRIHTIMKGTTTLAVAAGKSREITRQLHESLLNSEIDHFTCSATSI